MSNCEPLPLTVVTATIFEELGFLTPTVAASEEQLVRSEDLSAELDFDGPVTGRLVLRVYGGVLPALAANMLGEWDTPSEELQRDALGELANVLCGNLLRSVYGSDGIFRLSAPSVPAAAPRELVGERQATVLGVDQGRAVVEIFIETPASSGEAA